VKIGYCSSRELEASSLLFSATSGSLSKRVGEGIRSLFSPYF
jgi:hypothetical protein